MAIRIEWDEFEIALLIEACEEVLRKGKPKFELNFERKTLKSLRRYSREQKRRLK